MDDAQAGHAAPRLHQRGQVHRVLDVAVLQIVLQLLGRHDGAVLLALRRGGPQMGDGHHVLAPQDFAVGEVGDVAGHLAAVQGGQHVVVVDQGAPRQVEDAYAALHHMECVLVEHSLGLGGLGHVEGDVVAVLINGLQIHGPVDQPGQGQSSVHRQEGVVAVHIHAQGQCDVGDQ